jgi:hypothetical protein
MPDIDQLIEMALDFSEIGLSDPYDPATHSALVGQRVRVYVAATTNRFWDIVQNGMYGTQISSRTNMQKATIFFDQNEAADAAYHMAYEANGQRYEGPIVGIILVCEKKVQKLTKPSASLAAQLATQVGAIQVPMIDTHIQPRDIVGIIFPADRNKWAYPVREFIRQAKWGRYEAAGLPGPSAKVTGLKFGRATPEDWQQALLRYLQDLLNYSNNYFEYLTDRQSEFYRAVLVNSAKTGRSTLMEYTPRQMMEWLYSFLPLTRNPENTGYSQKDDIEAVVVATAHDNRGLPFWRLYSKYSDTYPYDVLRGHRKPPTTPE